MKKDKILSHFRRLFYLLLASFIIFSTASCSRKMSFGVSPVVPAATGWVKIKKDKNENYAMEVRVTNLAIAERLSPPRKVYIVWMVTESNGTKNLGQLSSSSSFLSKTLKASLKTVSSFKPERFFITAEDDAAIQFPGSTVVMNMN